MIETAHKAPDYTAARRHMIESQLRTSGINDRYVLDRMAKVPREDFVPENARSAAYVDRALPLGPDTYLAAPLAQGQILTYAKPRTDDQALIIGPATGYLAALLRPLVADLREATPDALLAGNVDGVFDLVIVDGAVEQVPSELIAMLAPEGRLLTGVVRKGVVKLEIGRRSGSDISLIPLAETQLPKLPAFDKPQAWTF